ncbi:four helix bundle protein [Patescibacteria group bacterium]|nr:four helix bundle protein [Patescibacteria group bacterium]MBU1896069.1 four helix bundle protein [Patescibacteria group bacterium]
MDKKGGFGHTKMIVWQEIDKLDTIVQDILKYIPRGEYKTRSQIDTASDSIGSNFVEGYYSGSLGEYIRFLRYSKRSNGELHERVRRIFRKKYIDQKIFDKFEDNCIRVMYLIDRTIQSLENKRNQEKNKK